MIRLGEEVYHESLFVSVISETDGRHFVFVHGYNVDAAASRTWARAMFKRLWWAGSRSAFIAVDWRGDYSQFAGYAPNYWANVEFLYYLNPTPLDRNLEWDMKTNLCPAPGNLGERRP